MINTAIILAGGLGTRLRPLTDTTPKPLLPLKNRPILEYLILNLKRYGVENIILSIGYKADLIQDYFQDGSKWGVKITYLLDGPESLGTGGSVKLAASNLTQPFFLLWGDNLMDINLKQLQETHYQNNTLITMTLTKREDTENFGVAALDGNKIISFVEKPLRENAPSNWINAGAFVIEPKVLDLLPEGKSSIEKNCFEKIAKENQITAHFHKKQWFPTDTLEKYQLALENFDINPIFADPNIFKAYDVRGEWNSEWDGTFTYALGLALVDHFHPKVIAIGRDMRNSSEEIFQKLSAALCSRGCKVKDLGLCGTELTYFAASFDPEVDLALMITASHNPGKDNGLKVTLKGGIAVGLSTGLGKVRDLAFEEIKKISNTEISSQLSLQLSNSSLIQKTDLWQQYREHVIRLAKKKHFPAIKNIVIDAGNGMGGYMLNQVFSSSPMEVIKLFWDPDGNFPNHPADPFIERNVESLKQKVVEEKAALGIALDGDSDRLFVVDENGRYIPGYYLTAILTDFLLSKTSSPQYESIAYDPRYYRATVDVAAKYGTKALPSKAGHTLIKAKMREHHCLFSAECSGHIFYRENNYAESSMLTLLLVLQLIEEKGPLSSIANHYFQNYPISGEINFIVENPAAVVDKIKDTYVDAKIDNLDGISIEYADWRCNVRSSNTQPLLRLNVEAKNKELVQQKVAELKQIIGGKIADH